MPSEPLSALTPISSVADADLLYVVPTAGVQNSCSRTQILTAQTAAVGSPGNTIALTSSNAAAGSNQVGGDVRLVLGNGDGSAANGNLVVSQGGSSDFLTISTAGGLTSMTASGTFTIMSGGGHALNLGTAGNVPVTIGGGFVFTPATTNGNQVIIFAPGGGNASGATHAGNAGLLSASGGVGGNASTTAGGTASGGGSAFFEGGNGGFGAVSTNGPGAGGSVAVNGGTGGSSQGFGIGGIGGNLVLVGGNGGLGSGGNNGGNGGTVTIQGGTGGSFGGGIANGGNVTIDGGTPVGAGTPGTITIAGANATIIGIGNSGATTTITGTTISSDGTHTITFTPAATSTMVASGALTIQGHGTTSVTALSTNLLSLQSAGGNVSMDAGGGTITIGGTNATVIGIGNATCTTTINGIARFSDTGGDVVTLTPAASSTFNATGALTITTATGLTLGNTGHNTTLAGNITTPTPPTNGQLLIGNGSSFSVAAITAGSNITITNGAGTITIATTAIASNLVILEKPADQSVTSSTVLVNDNDLTYNLQATSKYHFRFRLFVNNVDAVAGLQVALAGTVGVSNLVSQVLAANTVNLPFTDIGRITTLATGLSVINSGAGLAIVEIDGTIETTTGGTFTLQFAQNTSSGSAVTLQQGSTLELEFISGTTLISAAPDVVNGRLTLSSGVPITTTDVNSTTVYFTPYKGNQVTLFYGGSWNPYVFNEISIAVPATTSTPFDIFAQWSGTAVQLTTVNWTNTTTRATVLSTVSGRYVLSTDATQRYLGTGCTTSSSGHCADTVGGVTTQTGGQRFLWNYYNRILRNMAVIDTTSSWNYSTTTFRQADGATGNKVECVIGIAEEILNATVNALASNTNVGIPLSSGVGIDSVTVNSAVLHGNGSSNLSGFMSACFYQGYPAIGYHAINWLEIGTGNGTTTFYGTAGTTSIQSGMIASLNG